MADGAQAIDSFQLAAIEPPAIVAPAPHSAALFPSPSIILRDKAVLPGPVGDIKRNVAFLLAGGGAHGCFGASALAAVLCHPYFANSEIALISGVSAGAINGNAAASALNNRDLSRTDRRKLAARNLHAFWDDNEIDKFKQYARRDMINAAMRWGVDNTASMMTAFTSSVYMTQYFLMGKAPLRLPQEWLVPKFVFGPEQSDYVSKFLKNLIETHCQPATSRIDGGPDMFAGTTVICPYSGEMAERVYQNEDINTDVLLASSAVQGVFPKREIDGEFHIDGGYTANPNTSPIMARDDITDVVYIVNAPDPRGDSYSREKSTFLKEKARGIRNSWRCAVDFKEECEARGGPRVHIIAPDWMPRDELSLIRPTKPQNDALKLQGQDVVERYMATEWIEQPALKAA